MKNFSQKTKGNFPLNFRERRRGRFVLWIVLAFLVLGFLKDVVGGVAGMVTAPLYAVRHYFETSSATVPVFLRSRNDLLEHIQSLEQEVASQKGIDTTLAFVMEENEELRNLLQSTSTNRVVAGVIARPPFTPYDSIVLDRGSDDGVVLHAPVYHGKGVALGYVRSVTAHTALVTLFSSPGVESTVYVFGPNMFTTAYGEGGGIIRLSVPQGIFIEKGNIVVLPSIDTGVLGKIDEIQSIPTEPEQHAYVTFGVPMNSIRLVTVGTRPVEPATFEMAAEQVREESKMLFAIPVPEDMRMSVDATASSTATTTVTGSSTPQIP
jgi:cell shape-determining protein MreC